MDQVFETKLTERASLQLEVESLTANISRLRFRHNRLLEQVEEMESTVERNPIKSNQVPVGDENGQSESPRKQNQEWR